MTYMLLCETQHNKHTGHRVTARLRTYYSVKHNTTHRALSDSKITYILLCETQHTHRAESDSKMTYMLLCETQHNTQGTE